MQPFVYRDFPSAALASSLADTHLEMPNLEEMSGLSALRMPLLPAESSGADREKVTLAGRSAVPAWQNAACESADREVSRAGCAVYGRGDGIISPSVWWQGSLELDAHRGGVAELSDSDGGRDST